MKSAGIILAIFVMCSATLMAQDTQISARAKGMGGSYTAFGDDPISIWQNPAGTATQPSKFALSYTSFVTYEGATGGTGSPASDLPGESQATLHDPQFEPSFVGLVVGLGDDELSHAFSFGFINPINMQLTWKLGGGSPDFLHTQQQSSRFRFGYAIDLTLVESRKGWMTHIAVGGGIDWGSTTYESRTFASGTEVSDRESRFGFGAGILLTIYDDGEDVSVDLGASYNSGLEFDFNLPTTGAASEPIMEWPAEMSVGIAIYISRLKITGAYQEIGWEDAVADPAGGAAGVLPFEDSTNISFGIEYALHVSDDVTAFVRAGARVFDAPWQSETLFAFGGAGGSAIGAAVDRWALSIDTEDEEFDLGTAGFGVYWTGEDGKVQGFDFGIEFGGDKATIALGYVQEY